ncbi:VWA domain-containing protein [Hyunsoonleella sp. SJ7]|uniref:VWA domain-containing protein n=1 Tax=Hyunsoonleella aquatilis TaxID=2762758 RepID=A0A923HAL1_9FLAO|nr:VWA domain-containing protein [Hyunsoonleella aquatilis]MBC3759895.1 VWA domain-containing protein [Hyunsoonleella aquatilis]
MNHQSYLFYVLAFFLILVGCTANDTSKFVSPFQNEALDFETPQIEKYKDHGENPFIETSEAPISTFSVDADGGSYANMRRFLNLGQTPPTASVRIEEYINYFTFDYSEPQGDNNVGLHSETSFCPWNTAHHLIRIGMKGKTIPEGQLPNSNYVFLIDVSGSMSSPDKLGILKSGFKTLTDNLKDDDKIAIVTYAGSAGLLLPSTPGSEKDKIKQAIDQLGAGGSTAGAEGIITAYKIAEENFINNGNNRVILGSDGDFNVGPSSTEDLVELIEAKRETGIYLTVLGVGGGNLNDYGMEQIANKGNGNYEYIDNAEQIQKVFSYELGKLYTIAKDSKIQITFNENKVASYRLIGYENRALDNDDFEDDTKDAGEIGSSQTITALYEVVLKNSPNEDIFATFDFRYKKPNTAESILITHEIKSTGNTISENMKFATAVAGFGLIMKDSEYKGAITKEIVLDLANASTSFDPHGFRKEFIRLVESWQD